MAAMAMDKSKSMGRGMVSPLRPMGHTHTRHGSRAGSRPGSRAGSGVGSSAAIEPRIEQRFRHNPHINPLSLAHGGSVNALLGDPKSYGAAKQRMANVGGLRMFPATRSACKAVPTLVHWDAEKLRSVVATQMALSSGSVRKAFMRFDDDRSGTLDYQEMRKVLLVFNIEMTDKNFGEVMRLLDPNGDGSISYDEFLEHFGTAIGGGKEGPGGISAALLNSKATGMVLGGENKRVIKVNNPTWSAPALKKVLGEQVSQ